jgi:hypothetical protein
MRLRGAVSGTLTTALIFTGAAGSLSAVGSVPRPSAVDQLGLAPRLLAPEAPNEQDAADSAVHSVTLVTGDRVRLSTSKNGVRTVVPVPRPGRPSTTFHVRYQADTISVVPDDAASLLAAGRVDPRLFDVAGLAAAGYDQATGRALPLIVRRISKPRIMLTGAFDATSRAGRSRADSGHQAGTVLPDAEKLLVGWREAESVWRRLRATGFSWLGLAASIADSLAGQKDSLAGQKKDPRPRASDGTSGSQDGLVTLRIRLIDRNGKLVRDLKPFVAQPVVRNLETEEVFDLQPVPGGIGAQVPAGRYAFGEIIRTTHRHKPTSYTLVTKPTVDVTRDRTVRLDARWAKRLRVKVDAADARLQTMTFGTIELFAGKPWTTLVTLPGSEPFRAFALPTRRVTDRAFDFAAYWSLRSADRGYELVLGKAGQVPWRLSYRPHDDELARETAIFHAGGVGLDVNGVWYREAQLPDDVQIGVGGYENVDLPSRVTRLFTPRIGGELLPWRESLDVQDVRTRLWYTELCDTRSLSPGRTVRHDWNSAAFRPSAVGEAWANGRMQFSLRPFLPSIRQGDLMIFDPTGIVGRARLQTPIGQPVESSDPFRLEIDGVPQEGSTYTLRLNAARDVPWSRYATKVTGRWEFSSRRPADKGYERVRLINVLIRGAFDLYNRAPAGREFRLGLPVRIDGQEASGLVRKIKLAVSFDDGRVWRDVAVRKGSGGGYYAIVRHPNRPGGYVSVRTTVVSTDGSRYQMTSIRAYGLRRAG